MKPNRTARQVVGVEEAQDEVGIGHRWMPAAQSVAHGPRNCSGAPGPNFEGSPLVEPDHAATTGADLGEVHNRDLDGMAAPFDQAARQ